MDTFSEVFKAIASYPWQVNVGVLSLIPLYIIDFKFFCKLNIGLQRKIALAKERGHVARGMIVKEDANLIDADGNPAGTLQERTQELLSVFEGLDDLTNTDTDAVYNMATDAMTKTATYKVLTARLLL